MGYETNMNGEIEIVPPIPWKYVRESVFLPDNARSGDRFNRCDIMFRIEEKRVDRDEGIMVVRSAVALVPTHSTYEGNILARLQEVIDAFPEHEFRGRIDGVGEENEDMWRLKVVDRIATRFTPKLVWPKESE